MPDEAFGLRDQTGTLLGSKRGGAYCYGDFSNQRSLIVTIRKLPEGCYLATSESIPGLIVECETAEGARDMARELVPLLIEERQSVRTEVMRLTFINLN